ncbi:MAG: hypothetical protein MRY83_22305 [Flavobacteriales bacterium]|nr:hypothetical protein [Flavobacteriales bacterium]
MQSPFFGIAKTSFALHQIVKKNFPLRALPKKTEIFKKIFDGIYNDQKLRLVLSTYNRHLQEFLALQQLESKPIQKDLLTLDALNDLNKQNIVEYKQKQIAQRLQEDKRNHFNEKLQLEELTYQYYSDNQAIDYAPNLQKLSDAIDNDFLYRKLKYSCEILTRSDVLSEDYDSSFLNALIEYGQKHFTDAQPTIYGYFKIIQLIKKPDDKDYFFLKEFLFLNIDQIPDHDLNDMSVFIINYCIRQSNLGKREFLDELFQLYKDLIISRIILHQDKITLQNFKNIGTVALLLNEFEWLNDFSEQHGIFLDPKYRKTAKAYHVARVHFYRGSYKLALRTLHEMEHVDIYYDLGERALMAKILFEQDDSDLLIANINSFKIFIDRNKMISTYQKQLYKSFLKWLKRLQAIKEGKRRNYKVWLEEVLKTKEIADKSWVIEKFEELRP